MFTSSLDTTLKATAPARRRLDGIEPSSVPGEGRGSHAITLIEAPAAIEWPMPSKTSDAKPSDPSLPTSLAHAGRANDNRESAVESDERPQGAGCVVAGLAESE